MQFTIKQARQFAGLTQKSVAKFLNIDRGTYIKIEKDPQRATIRQVCKISELTGIQIKDIFLGDNSTKVERDSHES